MINPNLLFLEKALESLAGAESEAVNGLLLAIGTQGLMRTETMRAISLVDLERALQQVDS